MRPRSRHTPSIEPYLSNTCKRPAPAPRRQDRRCSPGPGASTPEGQDRRCAGVGDAPGSEPPLLDQWITMEQMRHEGNAGYLHNQGGDGTSGRRCRSTAKSTPDGQAI